MIGWLAIALAAPPTLEGTLGIKTNPAGVALFASAWWDTSDTVQLGPGLGVYFYWYELQAQARHTFLDGFMVTNVQAAAEPGVFLRADDRDGGRQPMLRPLVRAKVEFNLRNDLVWLYLRNVGWSRYRVWDEYDPFRDQVFDTGLEVSAEQSTALMISPSGTAERKVWFYVESTLEASIGPGWLDQVVRGGVIGEKITPAWSFDLDFYYSFMDTRIGGPGVLFVLWWHPPRTDPS